MFSNPYLNSNIHPITVSVIGCGGTGSMFLQELARINHTLLHIGRKGLEVTAIDPDVVTTANYGRQLFSPADIGRFKSTVLVERINRFYGFDWESQESEFTEDNCEANIIITCLDSIKSRSNINDILNNKKRYYTQDREKVMIWIDCGNDKNSGQVIMKTFKRKETDSPGLFDLYPDIKNRKQPKRKDSCSVAEAIERQDLMVNKFVALTASKLLWEILKTGKTDWSGAFINTETLNIKRIKI
jgi:PRTRC genetic system ThiF family protein